MTLFFGIIFGLFVAKLTSGAVDGYYGTRINALSQLHHGVSGEVYAVDSRTLFIKNFNYDGEGPAAYFYVGNSRRPTNEGAFRLRDERGSTGVIKRYRNKDITLSLPEGKTLRDVKWFSVWCDEFSVNFGDVTIPKNLDFPRPQKVGALSGVHEVYSDNIVIVDAQTLLIPNFSYDGEAPDAKFWVGRGQKPTPNGLRIPDENGRETPLIRYDKKTIVLTLPGDLTVFDIGHFGVWCEAFTVDFGHVQIPEGLNVPPSLRMLGISPQSKLNCEVLYDDLAFEVRWAVAGESVVVQLVAKLENGEYMSFGISPDKSHSVMVGADVVVAWVDRETGKGYANDYYLDAKSQCSGKRGSCPDTNLLDNSNSVRLLNAAMVNGYSIVTFQRPLKATDKFDLSIGLNETQAIVWAIGPLNQRLEVSFHSKYTRGDRIVDFGRQPIWNCPVPDGEMKMMNDESDEEIYDQSIVNTKNNKNADFQRDTIPGVVRSPPQETNRRQQQDSNRRGSTQTSIAHRNDGKADLQRQPVPTPKAASRAGAWEIPPIECYEPEDGVFYAQMGPTGGKQGYPAITGHVGWGISWYINGLLIPEINVVRGKTYTFVVEGGNNPEVPAKYHPFYITDDSIGGYDYKTDEEKSKVNIYAGIHRSRTGVVSPIGIGRLCHWTPDIDGPPADEYSSFGAYQRTLTLKCDEGEPGIITWRPDEDTPDTVYYQCFTHRYLGWKINVLDSCDSAQASEIDEVFAEPEDIEDSLVPDASIRHETKIRPNEIFLLQHEKDLIKHHNMNEEPPKIQFELGKSSEITKIIADGIKAAEALEESIANPKRNYTYDEENLDNRNAPHFSSNYSTSSPQTMNGPYENTNSYNSALSEYLRPPNVSNGPIFRPVKLGGRQPPPLLVERRRPVSIKNRPFIIPQPSMIVNHYKKPVSPFIRPFVMQQKPIKPIASLLLLGQQTEINPSRKTFEQKPNTPPTKLSVKTTAKQHRDNNLVNIINNKKTDLKTAPIPQLALRNKPLRDKHYSDKHALNKITYKNPYEIINDRNHLTRPAYNTGFQPDSVIVEGGFRPILRRRNEDDDEHEENNNRRRDDNISDIDEAMEGDSLFVSQGIQTKAFEPMFIPSPPDSISVSNKKLLQNEHLSGDLQDMEIENGDDKMAMAGERVDAYYLPPDTRKKQGQIYPEGAVVTYDGKAVLDMSLVNIPPPPPPPSNFKSSIRYSGHLSKSEQLVRNTPQFGPFTGEIPPPVPDFVPPDTVPQLNLHSNNNKPQVPVTEYTNPLTNNTNPISTKLTLLNSASRSKRDEEAIRNNS